MSIKIGRPTSHDKPLKAKCTMCGQTTNYDKDHGLYFCGNCVYAESEPQPLKKED